MLPQQIRKLYSWVQIEVLWDAYWWSNVGPEPEEDKHAGADSVMTLDATQMDIGSLMSQLTLDAT